eukprot:Lankesteria_metandrocarpae@DN7230_c0_g1_i1.p1
MYLALHHTIYSLNSKVERLGAASYFVMLEKIADSPLYKLRMLTGMVFGRYEEGRPIYVFTVRKGRPSKSKLSRKKFQKLKSMELAKSVQVEKCRRNSYAFTDDYDLELWLLQQKPDFKRPMPGMIKQMTFDFPPFSPQRGKFVNFILEGDKLQNGALFKAAVEVFSLYSHYYEGLKSDSGLLVLSLDTACFDKAVVMFMTSEKVPSDNYKLHLSAENALGESQDMYVYVYDKLPSVNKYYVTIGGVGQWEKPERLSDSVFVLMGCS